MWGGEQVHHADDREWKTIRWNWEWSGCLWPAALILARENQPDSVSLLFQFFHHALDQFLRVGQALHNDLYIHHGLSRPALALAIDSVLPYQGHGIGDRVHGYSQASTWHPHHGLVAFQFFLLLVEYRHGSIVMSRPAVSIQRSAH